MQSWLVTTPMVTVQHFTVELHNVCDDHSWIDWSVTVSLCNSVTMSQCHGALMWCGQYQSLHYLRENLLVTTIFHVSFMILKHAKASRKRETFIWTKILSVTMVGVVYKIQMVVSSTYSEVELLNFHIQLLQSCSLKKSCQSTLHFEHRHNLYQKYHYQERFLAGREEPSFEQVARRRTTWLGPSLEQVDISRPGRMTFQASSQAGLPLAELPPQSELLSAS